MIIRLTFSINKKEDGNNRRIHPLITALRLYSCFKRRVAKGAGIRNALYGGRNLGAIPIS